MELKDYGSVIWKRKVIILYFTSMFLILGIFINYIILEAVYTATSIVLLESPSPIEMLAGGATETVRFNKLDTEIQKRIVKNLRVAKRAGEILEYSEKESVALLPRLRIGEIDNTGIIEITYDSLNPKECADVANAYAKAFKETVEEVAENIKVRIFEEAVVPVSPIRPNRSKNIFIMVVLGFLIGIGTAFMLEELEDGEKKENDPYRPRIR